jgi:Rod binding domain-containing protein
LRIENGRLDDLYLQSSIFDPRLKIRRTRPVPTMTSHPLQFGKHASHDGHPHSHGGSGSLSIPRSQAHPHHAATAARAQRFGNHLAMVKAAGSGDEKHDELVKQTEKWVSQTFYGELMKQMRNSPFKSKMFSGGRGGEAFGEMFDQKLADKMAKGSGHKLVDAIVSRIEAKKAYGAESKLPTAHAPHAKKPIPSRTLAIKQMEGMQ